MPGIVTVNKRLGLIEPRLQRRLKASRCGNPVRLTDQLLLSRRQRGWCPGIGSDHIDHPGILVVVDALPVGRRPPRSDLLVIAGFIRPWVLWRGLFVGRPFLSHWSSAVMITVNGLMVEPLAWLQSLLLRRQLRAGQLPPDPIVVIGHWRSGTTDLHQLLVSDPSAVLIRNFLIVDLEPLAEQGLRELLGLG